MKKAICAVCGAKTSSPHLHHPALEENFPAYTVEVCGGCHNGREGLTSRQFDTGMLHEQNTRERPREPRPEPERGYDLTAGTADLIRASATSFSIRSGSNEADDSVAA